MINENGEVIKQRDSDKWALLQAVYPIIVGSLTVIVFLSIWYATTNNSVQRQGEEIKNHEGRITYLEKGREENRLLIESLKANQLVVIANQDKTEKKIDRVLERIR